MPDTVSELVLQDGYFLILGQDKAAAHSVNGSMPSTGYTLFPGVDTPFHYDIGPLNHTCSTNATAPNITQVNACALTHNSGVCCIDTSAYEVRG